MSVFDEYGCNRNYKAVFLEDNFRRPIWYNSLEEAGVEGREWLKLQKPDTNPRVEIWLDGEIVHLEFKTTNKVRSN